MPCASQEEGALLGGANPACRNLTKATRQRGAKATKARALAYYADVLPTIRDSRAAGFPFRHCKGNE